MTVTLFEPDERLVFVTGLIVGPRRAVLVDLALDTGSTETQIRPTALIEAGYDPAAATRRRRIHTAGGTAVGGYVILGRLICLGDTRFQFPVLAHDVRRHGLDGLLGLDFLRGQHLGIDFRRGRIRFGVKSWWRFWL